MPVKIPRVGGSLFADLENDGDIMEVSVVDGTSDGDRLYSADLLTWKDMLRLGHLLAEAELAENGERLTAMGAAEASRGGMLYESDPYGDEE